MTKTTVDEIGGLTAAEVQAAERAYDALAKDEILWIPRTQIDPDPEQVRTEFSAIEELREQIRTEGLKEILTVRPHPTELDRFMIVNGERRWRATEGLERVREDAPDGCLPCVLTLAVEDPADRLVSQYLQNTGAALTPLEEGRLFRRLADDHGLSDATIAKRLGVPRSSVGDRKRIADLPPAWTQLLVDKAITVSHAVELAKFRGIPNAVHEQAVKRAQSEYWWADARSMKVDRFAQNIVQVYRQFAYPLDKEALSYDQPALPAAVIAKHDVECSCGRVKFSTYNGKSYEYCGDPSWWKSRAAAAKSAVEQRQQQAEAKKAEKRKTTLELPKGTKVVAWDGYGKVPKGYLVLTDRSRWATKHWGRLAFDPDDLTIDASKLVRWSASGAYSKSEGVMTTDLDGVKAAHRIWEERWAARFVELQRDTSARVREVAARHPFTPAQGESLRALLLMNLEEGQAYSTADIAWAIVVAAQLQGIEVPGELLKALRDGKHGRNSDCAKWFGGVPAERVSAIASVVIAMHLEEIQPAERELETEKSNALREIENRKTPWSDAPVQNPCEMCENSMTDPKEIARGFHRACDEVGWEEWDDDEQLGAAEEEEAEEMLAGVGAEDDE